MSTEQSLQEQAFKAFIELEAEELKQLSEELTTLRDAPPGIDRETKALVTVRGYVVKRVAVLKEAHGLLLATEAARKVINKAKVTS